MYTARTEYQIINCVVIFLLQAIGSAMDAIVLTTGNFIRATQLSSQLMVDDHDVNVSDASFEVDGHDVITIIESSLQASSI